MELITYHNSQLKKQEKDSKDKMGHSISVYLIHESELRDEKIDAVLTDKPQSKIKWTPLAQGFLATTHIPNVRDFGKGRTIAKIETDYFGGSGNQWAKLFVDNKRVYDESDELHWKVRPINEVLVKMGVVRNSGEDEFDTLNLGKYRSNSDFN